MKNKKRIEWHLESWELSKLKPYDKNPRIITEIGLKQLEESFDEIGMAQPININIDGTILSGHARFKQLLKEKAKIVDVYVPDRKLSAKEEEAVIIRMNKNTAGTWDYDILANQFELEDLKNWGFTDQDFNINEFENNSNLSNQNLETESLIKSEVPKEHLNDAAYLWIEEVYDQIQVLKKANLNYLMGINKGYALDKFLKAKYDDAHYPSYCSFAFHKHQFEIAGERYGLLNALQFVLEKKINLETFKTYFLKNLELKNLISNGLPINGIRPPKDFPCKLAKDLINEFGNNGKILDPCHGWGGRLIGFLLSNAEKYVGIDPAIQTNQGVNEIKDLFIKYTENKSVNLHCDPFEEWESNEKDFDFALTSPPYFDVEKYEGGNQSHIKFDNYKAWKEGFYTELIKKVYFLLKPRGFFCLQIGSQTYPLLKDGQNIAKKIGFTVLEIRKTSMVSTIHEREDEENEVILVLQK